MEYVCDDYYIIMLDKFVGQVYWTSFLFDNLLTNLVAFYMLSILFLALARLFINISQLLT